MKPSLGNSLAIGIVFVLDEVPDLGQVIATINALADTKIWHRKMPEIIYLKNQTP